MNSKTHTEEKQEQALVPIKQDAEALIAKAIDKNVPVETMVRLLAMRRELKVEWAKEQFDKAMADFQAGCPVIKKDKIVYEKDKKTVRYKYAPLESIVEQVKGIIARYGFSYSVNAIHKEGFIGAACKVTHKCGHSEVSPFEVPIGSEGYMSEVQKYGARMTFAKRYAFCNAFGILTGDEDTDARQEPETYPENHYTPSGQVSNGNAGNGRITHRQSNFIRGLLKQKGYTEKELVLKYDVADMSQLTKTQASTIIENLQKLPDVDRADREADEIANDAVQALS